jgi:hypothetical protein
MSSIDVPIGSKAPAVAKPRSVAATKPKFITWVTLALMTTSSVASLRSAPTMAVYGLACVYLDTGIATSRTAGAADAPSGPKRACAISASMAVHALTRAVSSSADGNPRRRRRDRPR